MEKRLQVMGAFCLFLHHAHLTIEQRYAEPFKPRPDDLFHVDPKMLGGGAGAGLPALERLISISMSSSSGTVMIDRNPIPHAVIECAVDLLDVTLLAEPEAVGLAALINQALTAAFERSFSIAVVTGWSASEFFLNKKWRGHYIGSLAERADRPPTSKEKAFLEGPDFKASVITQILRTANLLTEEQVVSLDRVRKQRNAWAHSIESPTRAGAMEVVQLAIELFGDAYGVMLQVNPEPSGNYAV